MKKIILSLFLAVSLATPSLAATWSAVDRVPTVGKQVLTKNSLPSTTKFVVTETEVTNSTSNSNNELYIPKIDLGYAGNDNEVAAVIAQQIGVIINANASKKKFVSNVTSALAGNFADTSLENTALIANELSLKSMSEKDKMNADITGVDLIIDDTPEAVVISSFDPLRREIARLTLETLIKDGRIHPTRIEEIYDKTSKDLKQKMMEYGNDALFELGITKMDTELVELVGKLHFRTSYGQNALTHSIEVAELAGVLAGEFDEDVNLAKRAGLLHDIGKAIDHDLEGSHVELGSQIAKKYHENEVVINAIESHHGDTEATSIISSIVAIADSLSASRPGARNDSLENYIQRLSQLEAVGNEIDGVEKSFAVQAGRELRVIVKPEEVDDLKAHTIAREIKEKVETTLKYPGTIKITVVRETRAQEEAK